MPLLEDGQQVGSWTVQRRIGKGGNGEVYEVKDESGRSAALKILQSPHADSVPYQRFRREIDTLRSLGDLKGVLPLLDAHLPEEPNRRDRAWYVMPLAEPLADALRGRQVAEVVAAIATLAEVLVGLHADGIGHRDIKPENLYWYDGGPALGDFGLVSAPGGDAITEPGRVPGAFGYIADEMMQRPDLAEAPPADVFSLAKTLWKLLTPAALFPAQGPLQADCGPSTLERSLTVPRADGLDRILEAATRPAESRLTMAQFAAELRRWLAVTAGAGLPPGTDEAVAAARGSMTSTLRERDETAAIARDTKLARRYLVDASAEVIEAVRTVDPSGAVVGTLAIGRSYQLIEQPVESGTPLYTSTFHYGARVKREAGYREEVLVAAFVVQVAGDGQAVVSGMLLEGDEETQNNTFRRLQDRTARLGGELEAAIDEVVAEAAQALPDVLAAFAARGEPA